MIYMHVGLYSIVIVAGGQVDFLGDIPFSALPEDLLIDFLG